MTYGLGEGTHGNVSLRAQYGGNVMKHQDMSYATWVPRWQ